MTEETREYWERVLLPEPQAALPPDAAGFLPGRDVLPGPARFEAETEATMRATGNKHAVKGRLPVAAPRKYDPYWRGYQEVLEQMSAKELTLFQSRAEAVAAGCEREWARRTENRDDIGGPDADEGAEETPDALDAIAREILDIGRTYGWDNFGKMVEQLKKEGL